ncbi:hypothetical protein H7F51_18130 [Novosphingobium flavum]|uniref:Uncharacterized protein n=1 Tax=Novosphingobium flavum TaxID=1778672 RepID=A0A7X1KNK2_9SPHN|nr:hypothetical protein [Novosphingobium flavum]MBC2667440.1 hypothetical protein [Novosphingobium flavum]
MSGRTSSVDGSVENLWEDPAEAAALDRLLGAHRVAVPEGLAARIIAAVPQLPQLPAEPDIPPPAEVPIAVEAAVTAGAASVTALHAQAPLNSGAARWRRFAVPVGLGGLAAAAASLAAVFLVSAQGWQAPGAAETAAPAVAVADPVATAPLAAPELAAAPAPVLPADAHLTARRTPAATPVLALGKVDAVPVAIDPGAPPPAPSSSAAPELASNSLNPEAAEPPIPQLSPAEAAEVERRATRREAREARRETAPLPGVSPVPAMGLRATSIAVTPADR